VDWTLLLLLLRFLGGDGRGLIDGRWFPLLLQVLVLEAFYEVSSQWSGAAGDQHAHCY
jgi:hypothetical protein